MIPWPMDSPCFPIRLTPPPSSLKATWEALGATQGIAPTDEEAAQQAFWWGLHEIFHAHPSLRELSWSETDASQLARDHFETIKALSFESFFDEDAPLPLNDPRPSIAVALQKALIDLAGFSAEEAYDAIEAESVDRHLVMGSWLDQWLGEEGAQRFRQSQAIEKERQLEANWAAPTLATRGPRF